MLVWKKKEIRKGRNNIKRFFKKVLVGARSINNINTFLIFYPPPRPPHKMAPLPAPSKQTKRPPLFPTYSRAYKKTSSSQNIFHFYILSLTLFLYYLCTIYYYLSWISAYQSILPTFYEQLIWLKEKKILLLTTTKTPSFEWKWSPFLTWKL